MVRDAWQPSAGAGNNRSRVGIPAGERRKSGQFCNVSLGSRTCIYSNGYNTCNSSDPNRFERGLKVLY